MSKNTNRFLSLIAMGALVVSNLGFSSALAQEVPATVKVTIMKHIGESMATAESASSTSFQMSATWNSENFGAGTGQYALAPEGFNGDPTPYQAITGDMTTGADYSTSEIMDSNVGASCEAEMPYALVGYTYGDTMEEAEMAEPSLTAPAFVGMTSDKFVIVWNRDCSIPVAPESVYVTIHKFVQGAQATASSADSSIFPMSATWAAENIGAGTGEYSLDASGETPYVAMTVAMDAGANYSTNEILTGETVAASCEAGKPFALAGYTTGDTYEEAVAASSTMSMTVPAFTNMTSDKHVIVWNTDCVIDSGEIGGEVTAPNGALAVTSVEATDTTATSDGSFENGWEYVFHITAPMNEQDLAMKFSNWTRTGGGGTLPVAGNMRISSAQADNASSTVLLTAADTYSTPPLHMTGDLNPAMAGRQVEVLVEVAVPAGTPDGSYTTNYGVKTTPTI